jgi:hypothetical protein
MGPVPVEKTKKRHGERGPGRKTLATRAAMFVAAATPEVTPLEFLLAVMRDPDVEPAMRVRVAQAAAPYVHPKPTDVPGDAPRSGPMVIDAMPEVERARIEERLARRDFLADKALRIFIENVGCGRLPPDEKAEFDRLDAWHRTLPPHLKWSGEYLDDPTMVEFLEQDVWGDGRQAAAQPASTCEAPGEYRKRLLSERQPPVERKAPPADDDDAACPPGNPVRHRSADGSISE